MDSLARAPADPSPPPRTPIRLFKQYDTEAGTQALGRKICLRPCHEKYFTGEDLPARFARALCAEKATTLKELLESFEFFQAVRKHITAPHIVDLCSGHGLVGALFALFERKVEAVTLVDQRRPLAYDRILAAADRIGTWTRPKLEFCEAKIEDSASLVKAGHVTPEASVVAVHACGPRTDRAIELALELRGATACLPCCRPHRNHPAPDVLKRELGGDIAIDVHRTYQIERAGYLVRWLSISPAITPMNRILVGVPR